MFFLYVQYELFPLTAHPHKPLIHLTPSSTVATCLHALQPPHTHTPDPRPPRATHNPQPSTATSSHPAQTHNHPLQASQPTPHHPITRQLKTKTNKHNRSRCFVLVFQNTPPPNPNPTHGSNHRSTNQPHPHANTPPQTSTTPTRQHAATSPNLCVLRRGVMIHKRCIEFVNRLIIFCFAQADAGVVFQEPASY